MLDYPFTTPKILTPSTFATFGGLTGTYAQAQLDAALLIAEQQMTSELGSWLVPVIVTGTYALPFGAGDRFVLELGNLISINKIEYFHLTGCFCSTPISSDVQCYIRNNRAGIIDIVPHPLVYNCSCHCSPPYQARIVWSSGFGLGYLAGQASVQLALTLAANLVLDIMNGAGEGFIGVQAWSSLRYSERRVLLRETPFGSSAQANYIRSLVASYKVNRVGKFGR
jgi:hypothetical protein